MGIAGRKPNLVSQRTGSNHGAGEIVQTGDTTVDLGAPDDLAPGAVAVWNSLVPDLAATGVFRASDGILLSELCSSLAMAQDFRRQLDREADKASPEAKRLRTGYREMMQTAMSIAGEFGISPVSRMRLGLMQAQGSSLIDALRKARGESD